MPTITLLDFARWVVTPVGAGAAVWATVAFFDKLAPRGLPSGFKFYAAFALAFLWPAVGYALISLFAGQPFSLDGLFLAVAVGYYVSQTIHRQNNPPSTVAVPLNITSAGMGGSGLMVLSGALTGTPVVDSGTRGKIADEDGAPRDLTATHAYEDSNVTRPPAPLE